MAWRQMVGGSLALLLLIQGTALADSAAAGGGEQATTTDPEPSEEETPLPWAELRSQDLTQPLLGGEYNRIMAPLWAGLEENWALRSHHITTACNALGSDMAYLRGRVPRQIDDAHRQMAPFQTKALTETLPALAQRRSTALRTIRPIDDTEAEALLDLIRAGDLHTYAFYDQLLRHLVDLDLAAYLDPAQDDVPLSRDEFLAYVKVLHQELQDPSGALGRHEQFLQEADRLIQDLLTTLREVRRSLAILEATKANSRENSPWVLPSPAKTGYQPLPETAIAPQSPQPMAQFMPLPAIAIADDAPVTRRNFLLAMMGLMASLDTPFRYTPRCGDYQVESFVNPAQEMQWEVGDLIWALDMLNLEIMALVNTRSR